MLTLSSISQRIEQLEEEEYSSTNAHLELWRNMVSWQFWLNSLPDKDTWRVHFNELPLNHPVRELAGKLTWLEVQLSSLLTAKRDGFWGERVYIALEALFTDMMDTGLSQEEISSLEAMTEGLTIVNVLLDNDELWQGFYEGKRQENERHELMLKYRGLAHTSQLTPQAEEWLKTFDAAFWQNFTAKVESKPVEVKPLVTQVIPPALPEILPETTKPKSEFIMAHWSGVDQGWLAHTVDGDMPIYRNRLYKFSAEIWENILGDSYLRQRWHEVKE